MSSGDEPLHDIDLRQNFRSLNVSETNNGGMPFAQANNPISRFPQNNFTSHSEAHHMQNMPHLA